MKRRVVLLLTLLVTLALVAAGCASSEASQSSGGLLSPEEAFDKVLTVLRNAYPEDAPAKDVAWKTEEVVLTGRGGEPVAGASRMRIYSDDWDALVSWALVSPEYMVYNITLKSPTRGWYWEGYVDANGGGIEVENAWQKMTEQMALDVAVDFVETSPTWSFDGIEGTLKRAGTREDESPNCWSFLFEFQSAHAGYGNRSGRTLAEVVTPHYAVIAVQALEVTSAVLDEQWDMMAQAPIVTESSALFVAELFVHTCPTYVFDGIPETLELVETSQPQAQNTWVFVYRFDSRQAGYGDRTGDVLAQVVTPHEAHITVENNAVVSAVMDEKWNMLTQEMLS
jgi:hypothetical protein